MNPEDKIADAAYMVPLTKAEVMPTGAELSRFVEAWQILKPMGEALMEHAREQLLADPESVPGWYLTEDIPIRKLNNVESAWAAAEAAGITADQFMGACSVSIGPLEEAMREKFGWRAKDTKAEFAKIMGEAITMETKRGSIQRRRRSEGTWEYGVPRED